MNNIKKKLIINDYLKNNLYTSKNLSEKYDVSIQYVNRILKNYKPDKISIVKESYYKERKNITEIAKYINISYPTIIKILQNNENYSQEKKYRKKKALINKRKCKRSYIENKRKEERELTYCPMYLGKFQNKMTIKISDKSLSNSLNL